MSYEMPKDMNVMKEYYRLNDLLRERFGDEMPGECMPSWETVEGAMEKAREGLRIGKYSIKELYGIDYDSDIIWA